MSDTAAPVVDAAPAAAPAASPSSAPETAAPEAVVTSEAPAAPAKIKVGGREFDPAELEAILSGQNNVHQTLREIARQKAELEAAQSDLTDPKKVRALLAKHGHDATKLAEDWIVEHLEDEAKTPEQKELEQYRADKAAREKAAEEAKQAEEKKSQEAQMNQLRAVYENQYVDALKANNLPRNAATLLEMTKLIQLGLDAGHEVTPDHAAKVYRARVIEANRPLYEDMSPEELETVIPEKALKAYIKRHQDSLRATTAKAPDSKQVRAQRPQPSTEKKRTIDDLLKDLGV